MRDFDFAAPKTLDDAVALMASGNGEARALAGGTDLIDAMRAQRRSPSLVVDIKNIREMHRLEHVQGDGLHLGAAVTCAEICRSAIANRHYPLLVEGIKLIGDVKIQNRATVGGNFCNAAPSADAVPAVLCLDGKCVIFGPNGRREVPAQDFFTGPGQTVLAPDELLVEILLPEPEANSAGTYERLTPRNEMDIAIVGVGAFLAVEAGNSRVCQQARIALAAVAPTPVRAREAELALCGKTIDADLIERAAELAARSAQPISDLRASAEYRLEMIKSLTRRTVRRCLNMLGVTPVQV